MMLEKKNCLLMSSFIYGLNRFALLQVFLLKTNPKNGVASKLVFMSQYNCVTNALPRIYIAYKLANFGVPFVNWDFFKNWEITGNVQC